MIFQNVKCYDFSNLNIKNINDYKYSPNGIVLKLRLKRLPSANEKLIDIPGLCSEDGLPKFFAASSIADTA